MKYNSEGKLEADYHYSIKEALKDRVIRPFEFVLENGRMDWTDDGIYRQVTFQDNVNKRIQVRDSERQYMARITV